jgi:L-fucose mutarotase
MPHPGGAAIRETRTAEARQRNAQFRDVVRFPAHSRARSARPASAAEGTVCFHEERIVLKGISPLVSPELLKVLAEMGHGDEIVLGDSNFPGANLGRRVLRADGLSVVQMLGAILPLFELDSYAPPLVMMAVVEGDPLDPAVEADFMQIIRRYAPGAPVPLRIDRQQFYERARNAFAILMTGENRKYGNVILKKGVIIVGNRDDRLK